jgi:type IV fimbrial biogenesis protein FimT
VLDHEERLLLMRRHAQSGMSLVELMVAIAIVGILLAAAMPTYTTWIQNTQIRTGADAILAGLQTARNEAIRRNSAMQLRLGKDGPTSWSVNPKTDPDRDPPEFYRPAAEGSPNATVTTTPNGADTVTFNALGRIETNADASPALSQITVDNPVIPNVADRRTLNIVIPLGGAIRMCDPKVAAGDPRAC